MLNLQNRIAIVTGGSRGIGAETAKLLIKLGAKVVFTYQKDKASADELLESVAEYNSGSFAVKSNIAHPADCKSAVHAAVKKFGTIDILVNNAGIWNDGEIDSMTISHWEEMFRINVTGTVRMIQLVLPIMKKQKYGKIINISSTAGQRGEPFHSHYAASKGAIISLTKSLAGELGPFNINVNSVAPGWVDTDMSAGVLRNKKLVKNVVKGIPIGRVPGPEDIAGPIVFLASDLSRHITGEILNVNGGSVLCG